ncbi:MAG: cellulase family glycosylhydrolase, partial [Candidatus Promineifilaceae bacterium]
MARFFLILFALGLAAGTTACGQAASTQPTSTAPETVVKQLFPSPAYGMHTNIWWKPDLIEDDLALVKDMGFTWVKQKFPWREIEGIEKGHYDWYRPDRIVEATEAAGLNLIVRLDRQPFWSEPQDNLWHENQAPGDLQDFADFCGAVASRYHGRIAAYQVWNEPNLSREWGELPPDPV